MHYKNFSTEDFIQDEFFQQWVNSPTKDNQDYWNRFLLNYPHQKDKIHAAREFILLMNFGTSAPASLVSQMRMKIEQRIDKAEAANNFEQPAIQKKSRRLYYGIAASILMLISFVVYFSSTDAFEIGLFHSLKYEQKKTTKGVRMLITLEDGTKVWLNADSKLTYSKNFREENVREVFLEGEAFFDVTKNKEKPFIVRTSDLAIKVLGTSFNVKSYAQEELVETTLVEGRVEILNKELNQQDKIIMIPDQKAVFSRKTQQIKLAEVDSKISTSWMKGNLVFKDETVRNVLKTLDRNYNIKTVTNHADINNCIVTADFSGQSLEQTVELLCALIKAEYEITKEAVIISGEGCKAN